MSSNGNLKKYLLIVWIVAVLWCGLKSNVSGNHHQHDTGKWRSCNESSFCTRLRAYRPGKSNFQFSMNSIIVLNSQELVGNIINVVSQEAYVFSIQFLEHSTIRFQMTEEKMYRPRFHPNVGLANEPTLLKSFKLIEKTDRQIVIETDTAFFKLMAAPAKLELYHFHDKNTPALVVNDMGRLTMEYNKIPIGFEKYYETFDGFVDTRPYGPMAVGLDFSFPKATNLYGLPMHLETLSLQSTKNSDPYRLFNIVDYDDHKSRNKRSMYGSVPIIIAHGTNGTAGVFWYNTADTFVDIDKPDKPSSTNRNNAHFMSETGTLDAFLFLGPSFYEVTQQYVTVTGKAPLPPYFSLGYHQSDWDYFRQEEVTKNDIDKNNFRLDAVWLDKCTDHKKYFTWDPVDISYPTENKNSKFVVVIDPHIKKDLAYKLYRDALEKRLFVRYNNGSVYHAQYRYSESAWLDFVSPETREYWTELCSLESFRASAEDVFIWNDMNEPLVFDGPEKTFPKDFLHYNSWEHRDVHNIFGLFGVASTYEGLVKRFNGQKRPFILSRSYYSGIQRYSAIWLGDYYASFHSMKNSIAMCLSASLGGISFCGADIDGFLKQPNPELLIRWYQLGAFMPFFRERSSNELLRRGPYAQDKSVAKLIRQALQDRQILLPFWYTLFYMHSVEGKPVMRPLVLEFSTETETFDIEYEYLIGDAILVRPLTEAGLSGAEVYFPTGSGNETWYPYVPVFEAVDSGKRFIELSRSYNTTMVFIRGGRIIPKCVDAQHKPLPSTRQVLDSDISLYVAPSKEGKAAGSLYIDDGESFAYKNNSYSFLYFEYNTYTIRARFADNNAFETKQSVTQIEIAGKNTIRQASANVDGVEIQLNIVAQAHITYLNARKGQLPLNKEWTVTFK